jgi:pilus assembly protein CpaB
VLSTGGPERPLRCVPRPYGSGMTSTRWADLAARLRGWPRRLIALTCLLLAAGAALSERSASPTVQSTPTVPVVVAAADVAVGTVLRATQLRIASWPASARPSGSFGSAGELIGRQLATPISAGEAVTMTRLAGPGLTAGLPPGYLATTAPVDAASVAIVHAGDRIDLMAPAGETATGGPPAHLVADQVLVLAVLPPVDPTAVRSGTVVVAAQRSTAGLIASAGSAPLVALVRGPP